LVRKTALGADVFGDGGVEGDDVEFYLALVLGEALEVELAFGALGLGGAFRDRAEFGHCVHGQSLDL
jgi:hypothetical protein